MRKIFLIILLLTTISGLWFLLKPYKNKENKPNPLFSRPNQLKSKLIDVKKSTAKNLEIEKKVYSESLHGGSAVFIGPYRAELALYKAPETNDIVAGLFLANSLGMPVYPKLTKIFLILKNMPEKEMQVVKNGLLLANINNISLPENIGLIGTLNGKKFSVNIRINEFRKEILNKNVEK